MTTIAGSGIQDRGDMLKLIRQKIWESNDYAVMYKDTELGWAMRKARMVTTSKAQ